MSATPARRVKPEDAMNAQKSFSESSFKEIPSSRPYSRNSSIRLLYVPRTSWAARTLSLMYLSRGSIGRSNHSLDRREETSGRPKVYPPWERNRSLCPKGRALMLVEVPHNTVITVAAPVSARAAVLPSISLCSPKAGPEQPKYHGLFWRGDSSYLPVRATWGACSSASVVAVVTLCSQFAFPNAHAVLVCQSF